MIHTDGIQTIANAPARRKAKRPDPAVRDVRLTEDEWACIDTVLAIAAHHPDSLLTSAEQASIAALRRELDAR